MEEEIKRFKFIGLNDKASQEHLLQNTLILSGFYSSVPARLLFVAVSRDFCYLSPVVDFPIKTCFPQNANAYL